MLAAADRGRSCVAWQSISGGERGTRPPESPQLLHVCRGCTPVPLISLDFLLHDFCFVMKLDFNSCEYD